MAFTKDDVTTIALALAFIGWFFLPTFVRWANRSLRRREKRELERPGFPVTPAPSVQATEREDGKAAE